MTEIICSGFGGQGVLTAGLILADAAMEAGKYVTWYPSYGSEMRGGTANCNVKISSEEIASPYCADGEVDILFTLNNAAIDKFEHTLRPGGLLLVNSSLVEPERKYREDVTVVKVPANDIAAEEGNTHGVNLVMLGALAAASADFDAGEMCEAVDYYFYKKKGKKYPANAACFKRGAALAAEQLG
ncbi:MAG TPA: 2-oxoacid:acceptor oxidoreductase family protein [Candidatus Scatomorpha stercoravium]|nr:2-oxoacid:acceptor oxidoreductase family protein [Candidatus Scatomorpha stercoravium]